MIDAIGRRLEPLYGTDGTLAAEVTSTPAPRLSIQEASLLNFFAGISLECRQEEWNEMKNHLKDSSFAYQIALILLHEQKESIDAQAKSYAIWLLEDCGNVHEAAQLKKELKIS